MDSMKAMGKSIANEGKPLRVFDWDKAARLIKESQPSTVSAGLSQDWEWTGGEIWRDGKIVPQEDTYTYLSSNWAIPELDMDGDIQDCFIMEDAVPEKWGDAFPHIYWPDSAREIIS